MAKDFTAQVGNFLDEIGVESSVSAHGAPVEPVTFEATMDNLRTDRDGETKLTLLIPLSEMENVKKLHDLHGEHILRVTVQVD